MKISSHQSAVPEPQAGSARQSRGARTRLYLAITVAALTVLVSLLPVDLTGRKAVAFALASVLVLWYALPVHRSAFGRARRGSAHTDLLASVAILSSYLWASLTMTADQPGERFAVVAVVTPLVLAVRYVRERDRCSIDEAAPRWLVPGVLALAVAALAVWATLDGFFTGGSAAVAVLVVGCSADFTLASPAAILTGTKRGMPLGLRFGGRSALDAARCIDTIVLDKHKTVTTGDLTVVTVQALDPDHDRNLRWFAGALEHSSDHPVAHAIAKLAGRGRVTDVQQLPGLGVSGAVDRHPVRVGSPEWIGLDASGDFGTTVAVEVDGRPLGHITVADAVRPHARDAVEELRKLGLEPVLVSDSPEADTEHVASQVGIDTRFGCVADDQRSGLVVELQLAGRTVAVAGERGVNSTALNSANLAITQSTEPGEEVSNGLAVSDIDVSIVAAAIRLSRATLARAEANRRFALTTVLVAGPLAALGLFNPMYATLIAVASTLVVAATSLRLQAPTLHPPVVLDED